MSDTVAYQRLASVVVILSLCAPSLCAAQDAQPPELQAIPGITADDDFPTACVSCHVLLPDGKDVRLSTLMQQWEVEVDSILLAEARSAAPPGLVLTGKHPEAQASLQSIPLGCTTCHGRDASLAPPFSRLMHRIHLVGGEANHFVSMFGGECTHCHKFDPEYGAWSIPTGPEPGT